VLLREECLFEVLGAGGDWVDGVEIRGKAYAWGGRDLDCALGGDGDFGSDDVLVPVALAGGDVAG